MTTSKIGVTFRWGAVHKRGGRLISRHSSLDPPDISCPGLSLKYPLRAVGYFLLSLYNQNRVDYAERYPDENIKWEYRTGENLPQSLPGVLWALFELKTRRFITWLKTKL